MNSADLDRRRNAPEAIAAAQGLVGTVVPVCYYDRDMQELLERGGVCFLGISTGDAR